VVYFLIKTKIMNIKLTDESIDLKKGEDGFWSFRIKNIKVERIPTKPEAFKRAEEIIQQTLIEINQ
jgi:hypothetical protein